MSSKRTCGPFGSIAAKKYAHSNNFRVAQFGGIRLNNFLA